MALRLEGAVEGVACAGTRLEAETYSVGGRVFLFVSRTDPLTLRFKLGERSSPAAALGAEIGAGGWAKLVVQDGLSAKLAELVAQSHSLLAAASSAPRRARARAAVPKRPRRRREN